MEGVFALLIILLFGWLGVVSYLLHKNNQFFRKLSNLTGGSHDGAVIPGLVDKLEKFEREQLVLTHKIVQLTKDGKFHLQKAKILRYNPFTDTGGDQSFILTLLDGSGNGVVVTSLHSRGQTRWYAKNVKEGKGVEHELSKEETQALKALL